MVSRPSRLRTSALAGAALLGALFVTACSASFPTAAIAAAATVNVASSSAIATIDTVAGTPRVRFAIDATIRNDGSTPIYIQPHCWDPVRVFDGTAWVGATTGGACTADLRPPIEIAVGGTNTQHVVVAAFLKSPQGVIAPVLTAPAVAGSYRLEFFLIGPDNQPLPESMRVSPTFTVTE